MRVEMIQYRILRRSILAILATVLPASVPAGAQVVFTEIGAAAGVNDAGQGKSVSWGDYDADGDLDLYLANRLTPNRMYRNNGDMTFTDVAGSLGLSDSGQGRGSVWADYDNDGDLDLFAANGYGTSRLYRSNGDGTFTPVGGPATYSGYAISAAWGDYDRDGFVDLYVTYIQDAGNPANRLYHNNGDGTFAEVGVTLGLNDGQGGMAAAWADYDNDEDLDLYVANGNPAGINRLYRNEGNGTFTEVGASAGVDDPGAGLGVAWADYDRDGNLDLFLANGVNPGRLFRNNGDGTFTDVAPAAGVAVACSGPAWADYDNDGYLDLFLGDSSIPNALYRNNGDGTFTDVAAAVGVDDSSTVSSAGGASWADIDSDGDLDLYVAVDVGQNWLYRNEGTTNHWLTVKLVGTVSNGSGIGAQVTAVTGAVHQRRDVDGGSGFMSQPSLPVEFGFGSTAAVDSLIVLWPSGIRQVLTGVATDQMLVIEEAATIAVAVPDTTTLYQQELSLPVRIGQTTGGDIVAAEIFLSYDGDLLTPVSTTTSGTLVASGWSVETNVVESITSPIDTLKIAMATAQDTLSGEGALILVNFRVADFRHPASSALTIDHVLLNEGTPGTTATHGSCTLVGTDGTIESLPDTIIPRQTIGVTVADIDEDRDTLAVESLSLVIINGAQTEALTVTETGVHTGLFTGSIGTAFSLSFTSDDGVVQARAGDDIAFLYVDSLEAAGITALRSDTTDVVGGHDAALRVTMVSQPGDTVRVRITDADLNTDPGQTDSASVAIVNPRTGEAEALVLAEVGLDDSSFYGRLCTAFGDVAGNPDDGVINTRKSDSLVVAYYDEVTLWGDEQTLSTADVVVNPFGDADANDQVQAFDAARVLYHRLHPFLTGLDSLSANVDLLAPFGPITAYDASLILQKRVGLISRFEVQEPESDNHPQPETTANPKVVGSERLLSLRVQGDVLSLWMEDRAGVVSGDILLAGLDRDAAVSSDLEGFLYASDHRQGELRLVFAAVAPAQGEGELVRLVVQGPMEGIRLSRAELNDGRLPLRLLNSGAAEAVPATFALYPNRPNPFNPSTSIRFDLPETRPVELVVYDVLGRRVKSLLRAEVPPGAHVITWDGRDDMGQAVASGTYLCRIDAGDFVAVRRMLLLK